MPPSKRQPVKQVEGDELERDVLDVEPEDQEEAPEQASAEPDLCGVCFPAGWPKDAYSAGCEHGSYLHHERAAQVR